MKCVKPERLDQIHVTPNILMISQGGYLWLILIETCMKYLMMTSSNGNIFRVTGPLCGEFTGRRWIPSQRPVTRSFDVFFDLRLNKRLSKQSWGWWFETPSRSLLRQCNVPWNIWSCATVLLCFELLSVHDFILVYSCHIHILSGCFTDTGAFVWLKYLVNSFKTHTHIYIYIYNTE